VRRARRAVSLRDLGFYVRGRVNSGLGRLLRAGPAAPLPPAAPLDAVLAGARTPLALTRLLEGRTNPERERALARYLVARGVSFERHRFATFEGSGENFAVDVGSGPRVVILIAHHDAVPGSPGANDNAASVAILLALLERLVPPRGVTVRLLFAACEELGYLGARAWVRERGVDRVAGVLSLELCGVGDTLAIWDAPTPTPFLERIAGGLRDLGLRADETYHIVGRIPVFGSDHRAFEAAGVPAYGLTVVPAANAEALRAFVFRPLRRAILAMARRPAPFDTYHTSRDASSTLSAQALDLVGHALDSVVEAAARG